jgi:chaperone modulatory protein CbpM
MTDLDDVMRLCRVERIELETWIEREWVLPARSASGFRFSEADVARVALVCDLRRDLAIDEEAMPVVLSLIDQVYALRRSLRRMSEAAEALPEPARSAFLARLNEPD